MSVLYRAVWSDIATGELENVVERLRMGVASWSQETSEPTPLTEGESELDVSQGRHRVVKYRQVGTNSFEVVVTDQQIGQPTIWTVLVQVVAEDEQVHILVENHMESDDLTLRVAVGRPLVVHELLAASGKPRLGNNRLLTEPQAIPAEGIDILIDILADPRRTVPVIVCTTQGGGFREEWLSVARTIAARAEGIAIVITLDTSAAMAFRSKLGNLAIWGGGIRVYSPVPVTAESDGWRHRYYLKSRLEQARQATINRIVYSVSQLSIRRRVPEPFQLFRDTDIPADALDDMIPTAELAAAREAWDTEREIARDGLSELEKELAGATGHLARLKDELISRGLVDLLWGTQHEDGASIPDVVQDTSEAVLAARTYLYRWLAIPDSADRELDDIDTAPNAFAWGNTTWRGLRALAAYAEDRSGGWDKGSFWDWCASGPVLGWPATSKKLSMTESESVRNNDKLARTRVFEIDRRVDTSGRITMLAHLKISEGGSNLAPRVYFHDDTNGPTKMVHVGLVGPHYLVPNLSTN